MFVLRDILAIAPPLRLIAIATIASILLISPSAAQTYSNCNPTESSSCPPDPALGKSINIKFADGASNDFTTQGDPTYDSNGASFTISESGDAPTLVSNFYIMFGTYSITMKAAPGKGIVSSAVLQSDDLDEIDWEWLGAQNDQVQTNYFGKGQTGTYNRASVVAVSDSQNDFHTYTIQWTENQIVWSIDGTTVRALNAADADGQYPQTPMQLKIGAWSGGDPSNAEGTIEWAQGPTDYSDGPFTMIVQSLSVTDYSTGTEYTYGDTSGTWETIESTGGKVNANEGASPTVTNAPAITATATGDPAWRGESELPTAPYTSLRGLPSGWTVNGDGKVVPPSAAPIGKNFYSIPSSSAKHSARTKADKFYSRHSRSLCLHRRLQSCLWSVARLQDITLPWFNMTVIS